MFKYFKFKHSKFMGFGMIMLYLLTFVIIYSWFSWGALKRDIENRLSLMVELESKSLDAFFSNFESGLSILSQDLQADNISLESERAHLLLQRFNRANPDLANVVVVRNDGQIIASALNPAGSKFPSNKLEPSFVEGLTALQSGSNFNIGRPIVGKLLNEWVIPLRFAMRDANGALKFMLAATLPISRQESFWKSLYLPEHAVLEMIRDDNYLLSQYPLPPMTDLKQLFGQPRTCVLSTFLQTNRFPTAGLVEGLAMSGAESIFTFRRLEHHPLTFAISIPGAMVLAQWWKMNQAFFALSGIFMFSGFIFNRWNRERQAMWDAEIQSAQQKVNEINLAKNQAEKDFLALELDHVKLALDEHSLVSITDTKGNITYGNKKFCEVSGYSREELLGQNHRILNSGLHPREFFDHMWRTIAGGKIWHGEVRNKRKDGTFYWVDSTIVPFLNNEGKPYQYVSVRTDIRAYVQAKADAENANLAKSQFLSSMSHELRTPLNAVLGFAQLLAIQIEPSRKEEHESVNYIIAGGKQLLELVNDLLDLSRIELGKLELDNSELNMVELVSSCVLMVEGSMANKRKISIVNLFADSRLRVKGDAQRVRQVLINLLSNAVKYNLENGQVTLSSEKLADGKVKILVRDTGLGIAPENQDRLFGHFERLDQKHGTIEGAGIGLYVSKQLVEAMQGEIGVESVLGQGSTFWFTLPEAEYPAVLPA